MTAGISADYYLRLEQGRDRNPSVQVVDALAQALRLDEAATRHLHMLARPGKQPSILRGPERASSSVERLISNWPDTPAMIIGRYLDVLAANQLAAALIPGCGPGVNMVEAVFCDPDVREIALDWEAVARQSVARLRALAGPNVDDPRLAEIVEHLAMRSDLFQELWRRHDVVLGNFPVHRLNHPVVGRIELQADWLRIEGSEGQWLLAYHAMPETPDARALSRLRKMQA
jgi:transcriptional regulator with XRE-family HTH domain